MAPHSPGSKFPALDWRLQDLGPSENVRPRRKWRWGGGRVKWTTPFPGRDPGCWGANWAAGSIRPHPGLRRLFRAWELGADLGHHPLPPSGPISLFLQTRTWTGRLSSYLYPTCPPGQLGLETARPRLRSGLRGHRPRPPGWRQGARSPRLGRRGRGGLQDQPGWKVGRRDCNFQLPAGRGKTRRGRRVETPPPLRPEAARTPLPARLRPPERFHKSGRWQAAN